MSHYTRFSARASLGALGLHIQRKRIWDTVERCVHIEQKVIWHAPTDKLLDAFINILAGGHGLVEVNKRVRPDEALQRAFGRQACADQSTISDTLNACAEENVEEMRQALQAIYRTHSQGYRHNYQESWQVLDVDMTGMPAGRQGEGVTKGFFSGKKGRRGRQLGRVLATLYDEIVAERLYAGTTQLERSLQELVMAAEEVLDLDEARRQRTVIRVDGGGGRDADINWLLGRGYHVLVKVKNWKRAAKLARSVNVWHTDPKTGDRQVGWVEVPHTYVRPTRQLAIRTPKKDGSWLHCVLVSTLANEQLRCLARQPVCHDLTPMQVLFAMLYAYDLRSGGIETSVKGSKQGLGLTKRNKKRFSAQEMLVLLAQLAYNLIVWTRNLLASVAPKLQRYGILRMIRDVFHIDGRVQLDTQGHVHRITLNEADELALPFTRSLLSVRAWNDTWLNLGQI
jgi:hypothetical protein